MSRHRANRHRNAVDVEFLGVETYEIVTHRTPAHYCITTGPDITIAVE